MVRTYTAFWCRDSPRQECKCPGQLGLAGDELRARFSLRSWLPLWLQFCLGKGSPIPFAARTQTQTKTDTHTQMHCVTHSLWSTFSTTERAPVFGGSVKSKRGERASEEEMECWRARRRDSGRKRQETSGKSAETGDKRQEHPLAPLTQIGRPLQWASARTSHWPIWDNAQ